MKFAVVVVILALAVGAHSSLLSAQITGLGPILGGLGPWGAPIPVNAYGAPGLLGGIPGISLSQGPLVGGHGLWGGIPGISLSQGPLGAGIAAPLAAPHALGHGPGVYVAKTRGAIHTAPLDGHINSATSLNLAPAPGTL